MMVIELITRLVFPRPDWFYKLPNYRTKINATTLVAYVEHNITNLVENNINLPQANNTKDDDADNDLSIDELKVEYLPEFLLDNNNVYDLYTGENQYVFNFSINKSDYNTRYTQGEMFSEDPQDADRVYEYRINFNSKWKPNDLLYQMVDLRIPLDDF